MEETNNGRKNLNQEMCTMNLLRIFNFRSLYYPNGYLHQSFQNNCY